MTIQIGAYDRCLQGGGACVKWGVKRKASGWRQKTKEKKSPIPVEYSLIQLVPINGISALIQQVVKLPSEKSLAFSSKSMANPKKDTWMVTHKVFCLNTAIYR